MGEFSTKTPPVRVLIDGFEITNIHVRSVTRVIGGSRSNHAELEVKSQHKNRTKSTDRIPPSRLRANSLVKIYQNGFLVHIGRLAAGEPSFDPGKEDEVLISRFDQHLFGVPTGFWWKSFKRSGAFVQKLIHDPLVINPLWDGKSVPNQLNDSGQTPIHPDSIDFLKDLGKLQFWNIPELVLYVCEALNGSETYIINPTLGDVDILSKNRDDLRDFHIPHGLYLPQVLDMILEPFGFNWWLVPSGEKYQFGFSERGKFAIDLPGSVGEVKTNSKADPIAVKTRFDHVDRSANNLILYGSKPVIEATWELYPNWGALLNKDVSYTDCKLDPNGDLDVQRVGREFVLNENGEYIWFLDEAGTKRIPVTDLTNLIFDNTGLEAFNRRRRFLPTISADLDGSPIGPHHGTLVEWWDGQYWRSVTGGKDSTGTAYKGLKYSNPLRLLKRECGIRFEGTFPPTQFFTGKYGVDYKVRITASIEADSPMYSDFVARSTNLVDTRSIVKTLSGFQMRVVDKSSIYLAGATKSPSTTAVNDQSRLDELSKSVVERWSKSNLSGTVSFQGTKWVFTPSSDFLGKDLRSTTLKRFNFNSGRLGSNPKFPTIVQVTADFDSQQTTLTLDSFSKGVI